MQKTDIIESVFEVYGQELPDSRSLYSASKASPIAMLEINKAFKSWKKFRLAYTLVCMEKKRAELANSVIKKEADDE